MEWRDLWDVVGWARCHPDGERESRQLAAQMWGRQRAELGKRGSKGKQEPTIRFREKMWLKTCVLLHTV